MTEPAPALSPYMKKMNRAQQAKQTRSGFLVVSDVEIQEPNWCSAVLSSLLNDPSTHDVTFKTSDGGSVSAHRVIVAAGSPVLYEMLQDQTSIKLEVDMDTVAFSSLVKYIYTGKVAINSSNLEKILTAANYFKVASLETNIVYCISNLLCTKNVVAITIIANDRNCEELLDQCVEFMCASASDVIRDPNFTKLPDRIILDFCKSSDLNVSELDLFLAVARWQKHNKKAKTVIKNIFREIRYPLISNVDLVTKVGPTGLADPILYTAALEYHVAAGQYKGPSNQLMERRTHGYAPSPMKSPRSNTTTNTTITVPQTEDYYVFPEPSAANQLVGKTSSTPSQTASKKVVMKKPTPSSTKVTPSIKKETPGIKTESSSIRMESLGIETKPTNTVTQPPVVKKETSSIKKEETSAHPLVSTAFPINAAHKPGTSVVPQSTTNRPASHSTVTSLPATQSITVTMPGRRLVYTTPASSDTTKSLVTRPTKVTAASSPVTKISQAKSKYKSAHQPVATAFPIGAARKPGTSVVTQSTTNRPASHSTVTSRPATQSIAVAMPGRRLVYTTPVTHSVAATNSGYQQASVATINPTVAMSLVYNQTANKGTHGVVTTSPQGIHRVTGRSTVLPKNAATTPAMSYFGTSSPGRKRKRCNTCEGCRASSCGTCLNCVMQIDPKKICVNRICQAPQ